MSTKEPCSAETTGSAGSNRNSSSSTPEPVAHAPRRIPLFQPIHLEDAKARATVEEWRTFTVLLEPQVRDCRIGLFLGILGC